MTVGVDCWQNSADESLLTTHSPLQCDSKASLLKSWSLSPHLLSLGWPDDLLWPINCNSSNIVPVLILHLKTSFRAGDENLKNLTPFGILLSFYVNEPGLAHWSMKDLMEESQVPWPVLSQTQNQSQPADPTPTRHRREPSQDQKNNPADQRHS